MTTHRVTGGDPSLSSSGAAAPRVTPVQRLWKRQLDRYPDHGPRTLYLGITVLATIILYYELYVQGAVSTQIIAQYGFTFSQFVLVLVVGNAVGAMASLFAGLADRWGRANLVVGGLLLTGLLILVGLPHAPNKATYLVMFALVSLVEGVVLVATPALIRDFSPQVGRGAAMGFWTLGPVLGSLVVSVIASNTLEHHTNWRFQFYVCGIVGLAVFLIALVGLRELSPRIRDQLMVDMRDRALIEARAAGVDPEQALQGSWRQMLRFDIVGSALAISLFLLFYYMLVAFAVVYFVTTFGFQPGSNACSFTTCFTEHRANALLNWYWAFNAIALVVAGVLSDALRVRKPVMLVGAVISLVGAALFAVHTTDASTSYYAYVVFFILASVGGGAAYVCWMAAFTETVEHHNPAATATGLAIWGWILRLIVTISFAVLPFVVPAASTIVDKGPQLQHIVATYPRQVATLQTLQASAPQALTALQANPNDLGAGLQAANALVKAGKAPDLNAGIQQLLALKQVPQSDLNYLNANAAKVQKAQADSPKQWQHWWWVCFAGQVVFLPLALLLLRGRWNPRKARRDQIEHDQMVEQELAAMHAQHGSSLYPPTAGTAESRSIT